MNRLVIIGNGFDLAHGLKTSYKDFIRWYLCEFVTSFLQDINKTKKDELLTINREKWGYDDDEIKSQLNTYKRNPWLFLNHLENGRFLNYSVAKQPLLDEILQNIENKGWTDIESDYYALLKGKADNITFCKDLNTQMDFLRDKLAKYLDEQKSEADISGVRLVFLNNIRKEDIAQSSKGTIRSFVPNITFGNQQDNEYKVESTMLLDFNYTSTTDKYKIDDTFSVNHIHGSLSNPEQMIFGYGDEMDKDFQKLEDRNENELLKNAKSVKYLEDDKYRKLMKFIGESPYQVFIMGHSCGNSDRTLLHTIFEHENCISIKPFYHEKSEIKGDDDYSNIIQNIYRNFKDKTLFRDRVVNKMQCEKMPQAEKKEDENRN